MIRYTKYIMKLFNFYTILNEITFTFLDFVVYMKPKSHPISIQTLQINVQIELLDRIELEKNRIVDLEFRQNCS